MSPAVKVPLQVKETLEVKRIAEPVRFGVPFSRGAVTSLEGVSFAVGKKKNAAQIEVLDRWGDGSVRWALIDTLIDCEAGEILASKIESGKKLAPMSVQSIDGNLVVESGKITAAFTRGSKFVKFDSRAGLSNLSLQIKEKDSSEECPIEISSVGILTNGGVRTTILIEGLVQLKEREALKFSLELSLFQNSSLVSGELTILNPSAAEHPDGFWDLGDPASIYLDELNLILVNEESPAKVLWSSRIDVPPESSEQIDVEIYQESSGGENWRSENHMNRYGVVPLRFRGYREIHAGKAESGLRADPTVMLSFHRASIAASIVRFWENFPASLSARGSSIILGFFPSRISGDIELQGGEQKTFQFNLDLESDPESFKSFSAFQYPLRPVVDPQYLIRSNVLGPLTDTQSDPRHEELLRLALNGPKNFFEKREQVDEYGWRNFGCVWADHEAVNFVEGPPLVSHYNNQYDLIFGFLLQFAATGDLRWYDLARDCARHTIDIDIYHSSGDRAAYNGGLFWHTEHYLPANRSTHRTYSEVNIGQRERAACGGGPANEHNYTTGLLTYYWMTGSRLAKKAVIELANWVIAMDRGLNSNLRYLDAGPTGLASQTASIDYHGPGRGAGNSIAASVDGFLISRERKYLDKAEEIIRRTVNPADQISVRKLDDPESRWSYLAYFQSLGRYLSLKSDIGEFDSMYHYARTSLLHYAKWMFDNEKPYTEQREKIKIWTESWPAHDMRKAAVFDLAAAYAEAPEPFIAAAEQFYKASLDQLSEFETRDLTRPLAVILVAGAYHERFQTMFERYTGPVSNGPFPKPKVFLPRKERIKRGLFELAGAALAIVGIASFKGKAF